jgi:glycosyltransferase involved in cell wall biosynthesis
MMNEENLNVDQKGGQQFDYSNEHRFPAEMMSKQEINKESTRRGVGVCIISRGTVPIKWMTHMNNVKSCFPGGLFWKFIIVERMSWAAARNECIRRCRGNNFEWAFFIDDDVFIPENALDLMLRANKDIVSGIYWTKTENPAPVIFKEMGKGPMYEFEPDQVIPIGGSGAGCLLINMRFFDKFDEAGLPYFVENWVYTDPQGMKMKCPIGEDHYFFLKAKELGFQAYAHTGILCDHYDSAKDKFYPGEKIVKEYCKKKLVKEGRDDLVKSYDLAQLDPSKQTIVFYNNNVPFAGDELYRRGVGGSETDIINLAKQLSLTEKYNVRVYCKCPREGVYDNVIYKDQSKLLEDLPSLNCDLFISSRDMSPFMKKDFKKENNIKQTVLWGHDLAEDKMWLGFYDALPNIDKVVLLSEFHKHNVRMKFPNLKEEDIVVIRNGVDPHRYKEKPERVKGKCIYSSTPYRGLDVLLKMWPKIRQRVPHAELYIFSSIKVYAEFFDDSPWENLYNLAKKMEGVHYHGTVKQDRLAQEQMSSELLLYANSFPETCCVTAMENQTAGTPIISTKMGALPEVVGQDCGILLDGNPHTEEYQNAFIEAAVDLLTDSEKWERMHKECLKHDFSWERLKDEWVRIFLKKTEVGVTDTKRDKDPSESNPNVAKALSMSEEIMNGPDKKAWEVYCKDGEFASALKQRFPNSEVWGSDPSLKRIDECRARDKKVYFANHPLDNPEFEDNYFDLIVTFDYVFDRYELVHKKLKKEGTFIVNAPEIKLSGLLRFFDIKEIVKAAEGYLILGTKKQI